MAKKKKKRSGRANAKTPAKNTAGNGKQQQVLGLVILALVAVVIAGILVIPRIAGSGTDLKPGDVLSIPLDGITEVASFYPVTVDGTEMEVLAIRDGDGQVRTAFNTCQSCYTSGNGRYEAAGNELICQNCGFHFTAGEVGVETGGGCNPWPITDENRTLTDRSVEIPYDFLLKSRAIFANWSH